MKKLAIISFLFFASIVFSQEKMTISEPNFESIEISIDSLEKINTIKWEDFVDVFKENDPESNISLKVTVEKIENKKITTNFSVSVKGKASEIDNLVSKLKEAVFKLKKVVLKLNEN